jgi:hypothetical protein
LRAAKDSAHSRSECVETLRQVGGRGAYDALVIRTDYSDEPAWGALVSALSRPWGEGFDACVHFVDDSAWDGATVDEVLAVVRADEYLSVVFIADTVTMTTETQPLLAVTTAAPDSLDNEDYDHTVQFGREFRTIPGGVHWIEANLSLANMGYEEYAEAACGEPDGVFRGFDGEQLS